MFGLERGGGRLARVGCFEINPRFISVSESATIFNNWVPRLKRDRFCNIPLYSV